jgi:hypothetical protein
MRSEGRVQEKDVQQGLFIRIICKIVESHNQNFCLMLNGKRNRGNYNVHVATWGLFIWVASEIMQNQLSRTIGLPRNGFSCTRNNKIAASIIHEWKRIFISIIKPLLKGNQIYNDHDHQIAT